MMRQCLLKKKVLIGILFGLLSSAGCDEKSSSSRSEDEGSLVVEKGSLGYPCKDVSDCEDGLYCRAVGQEGSFCEQGSYGTSFTQNSCKIIECEADWHCYDYVEACQATYEACQQDPASGECLNAPAECGFICESRKCVEGCTNNNHCGQNFECDPIRNECICSNDNACGTLTCGDSGQCECENDNDCDVNNPALGLREGFACFSGTCGCDNDSDCGAEQVCRNQQCVAACQNDFECPQLHICRNRQCINEGCISDRECAALLRKDVNLVICDADKVCRVRCNTDRDCDDDNNFNKFERCSAIDVDGDGNTDGGVCKYVGCETNNECKALLFSGFQVGEEARDAIRGWEAECVPNGGVDFSRNDPSDMDEVNPNDPADPEYGRCDGCNPPAGTNEDPDPSR